MRRERRKPKVIVTKVQQAHVLASQGTPIADAIRSIGAGYVGLALQKWRAIPYGR
jgi:hypothetical protein